MEPFLFGPPQRRLFAVFHPARGAMRGAVLVCPPLLHEHMRSHRFFSQLCERLAEAGLACMRFDYHGTGDSAGADATFLPDSAIADIDAAAAQLRARAGDVPLALLGVRASALLANEAAGAVAADALWLWLPVLDGDAYVRDLDAHYARELAARDRYPSRKAAAPSKPGDLMGFSVSPEFRAQMASRRLAVDAVAAPVVALVCGERDAPAGFEGVALHAVPEAAAQWVDEIDLRTLINVRDVEPALQSLLQDWPLAEMRRHAHG